MNKRNRKVKDEITITDYPLLATGVDSNNDRMYTRESVKDTLSRMNKSIPIYPQPCSKETDEMAEWGRCFNLRLDDDDVVYATLELINPTVLGLIADGQLKVTSQMIVSETSVSDVYDVFEIPTALIDADSAWDFDYSKGDDDDS